MNKRIKGMFSALGVAAMMPFIAPMAVIFGVKKLANKDSVPTFIVNASVGATGISVGLITLSLVAGTVLGVTGSSLTLMTLGCYFSVWALLGAFIFHVHE